MLAGRTSPDVILMDIGLPDLSGIDATREIKKRFPKVAVVALTIHEDQEYFFKMLDAGALGYVPKRAAPEELLARHPCRRPRRGLSLSFAGQAARDRLSQPGASRRPKKLIWMGSPTASARC